MSVFGDGRAAAAALRARVLGIIGAEPEWTEGDHDSGVIIWTSGPATTLFCVEDGPEGAPDLGVLRVFTPVATVVDKEAAREQCGTLNGYATTSRWIIALESREGADVEVLRLACSFVVGPHNLAALEAFAAWCVEEQIAAATAGITDGLAVQLGGKPYVPGNVNALDRERNDWHEVVRHYERVVEPGKDKAADELAVHLQRAFLGLRDEMLEEGTGVWYSPEPNSYPLSCEMPANWFGYGEEIRWATEGESGPPTARLKASLTTWGDLGNGLLITMWVPAAHSHHVDQLNRLDEQAVDATHFVGAWATADNDAIYLTFLPAALLEQDIPWPVVMREVLLTFARQAQLARRIVLDPTTQKMLEGGALQPVGLQAFLKPHGLAWGETGEGRNRVTWYLDGIYSELVGDDAEWAFPAPHGFRWWPYQQAQEISVVQHGDDPALREIVRVRVATDVRVNVEATPEILAMIAKRNASLPGSALVLRDDGALVLACQLILTEALSSGAHEWAADLAIRQFVTARELAAEFSALGQDAASAHPVSGPRPDPHWWFEQFTENTRQTDEARRDDMPESRPQVALIAAGGQYALPYHMAAQDDGVLDFSWRPDHTFYVVPADPEIRVTAVPGTGEADPAWTIRSHLPVAGDEATKARWCNDRNTELLLAPDPPADLMRLGGWGLTTGGECCLTAGQTRQLVRGEEAEAARALGYLLREEQSAVIEALRATPEVVQEVPLTAPDLAAGLDTVHLAFGRLLGERADFTWAAKPAKASVQVTCGEITVAVPVGYGRPQLALVYGTLLVNSPYGQPWQSLYPLLPEPVADLAFEKLERDGTLWQDQAGHWVFDAGRAQVRLELTRTRHQLRVDGVADFLAAADGAGELPLGPGRLSVTIPPAQFAWATDYSAVEVLEWAARRVIDQVRQAATQAERSRPPALPEPTRLFGSGRFAAAALRARLLELLGSELEWMTGDHDSPGIVWNSGLATTMFEVAEGAAATPDLGVLRVCTPVAAAKNGRAARDVCLELNRYTATARWSVARESDPDGSYYDEVQVSCAFVVGPHNQRTMESFALWCVREQIAVATAHIRSGDVASAVDGVYSRYEGFPAGDERADWHPVTSFTERVVQPSASLSADALAEEVLSAFRELREAMIDERTSAWFTSHDGLPLTFETPFSWDSYPQCAITRMRISDDDPEDKPPTALLESVPVEHPDLGNGLRIAVNVPCNPRGHAGQTINTLNRLDAEIPGASYSLGGWTMTKTSAGDQAPGCVIFLPTAFTESVANRPLVMREILLTLARQALLARRVLLAPEGFSPEDCEPGLGQAIAADPLATFVRGPHGLAWGETGEGRNPAARVLDQIYTKCVGPDTAWADTRAGGFTWWPYQQAQDITATLRSANDAVQGVSVRIATEVRRQVPVTEETMRVLATQNAELGQYALTLNDDGLLSLACRLYVHEGIDHWANKWAQMLAADQFILARDISAKLAELGGFGDDAVSGHPFSGVRRQPDELFGIRENTLIPAANGVKAGLTPLVPILGLCRPYALPLAMPAPDAGGGLHFTWRLSQSRAELPVDAIVRVSARHGDVGSGPGWIVRSVVPVAGDEAARTRWCNTRNADQLTGSDDGGDHTFVGGWGVAPDGGCCLTTWLSPFFVPDAIPQASGLVGNVLSYHASAVLAAADADPGAITEGSALTAGELARGVSSVLAAFADVLEYPADFRWTVTPGADHVMVTLTGPTAGGALNDISLAEKGDSALRTVLRIPLTRNRAQLGLLYAAFLGRAMTRVKTFSSELIPGEAWEWNFTLRHIEEGLGPLDEEGILDWHASELAFTFDAGPVTAWLRFERVEKYRSYGGTALRLTATAPDLNLAGIQREDNSDADVLGSWHEDQTGVSYEVTIPPAGMIFGNDFIVHEMLTWVGHHVVTRVQDAVQDRAAKDAPVNQEAIHARLDQAGEAEVTWHHHGDGTGAITLGADVVASFSARHLVADKYPQNPPPDRSQETRHNVEGSTTILPTSERSEQGLVAWVAKEWQAQLDSWWMYGEPVFWCKHIEPDDDEQPLMEWFMRFPAAVACDQCADRIRAALLAGTSTAMCDSCGNKSAETAVGRTPGLSIIANYELCPRCQFS